MKSYLGLHIKHKTRKHTFFTISKIPCTYKHALSQINRNRLDPGRTHASQKPYILIQFIPLSSLVHFYTCESAKKKKKKKSLKRFIPKEEKEELFIK